MEIAKSGRSLAAAVTAAVFLCSFGIDLPAAPPSASLGKKDKQDPSLKNLPITELTPDEAIQHALNRGWRTRSEPPKAE